MSEVDRLRQTIYRFEQPQRKDTTVQGGTQPRVG